MLLGGVHGDLYNYKNGDGFDIIREPGSLSGATDRIVFGQGITSAGLAFDREWADLIVVLSGGDILKIKSWFGATNDDFKIEELQFDADPAVLGSTLLFDGTTWNGTSGNDIYTATGSGAFRLLGGDGNDSLTGFDGPDVLMGRAGYRHLKPERTEMTRYTVRAAMIPYTAGMETTSFTEAWAMITCWDRMETIALGGRGR